MPRARILILEEDRQIVDELRDNLELAGFETEVALGTQVAFSILDERKMDLVILGASIKEVEIFKKINDLSPTMPILALSEQKSKRYQSSLIKAGASTIVELPADKEHILKRIEELTEKPEEVPQNRLNRPFNVIPRKVSKRKKRASGAS